MFPIFAERARKRAIGRQLYESIVARARAEVFYRDLGVPDTMEGRFDLIVLHLHLVLTRLKREGEVGQSVGQIMLEQLIADTDDALRQIGYGDMGVPRRVQRAAAAIRERAVDYAEGLDPAVAEPTAKAALQKALLAHVFEHPDGVAPPHIVARAAALAAYTRASVIALHDLSRDAFLAARLPFAAVEPVAS